MKLIERIIKESRNKEVKSAINRHRKFVEWLEVNIPFEPYIDSSVVGTHLEFHTTIGRKLTIELGESSQIFISISIEKNSITVFSPSFNLMKTIFDWLQNSELKYF